MALPVKHDEAWVFAYAIVNTIRDPFRIVDGDLRVIMAGRSFYETFQVAQAATEGQLIYELGDGQWNIPALRLLLEKVIPERTTVEAFEVDHQFPAIGNRVMLVNARQMAFDDNQTPASLVAIEDISERKAAERDKAALLVQAEELLRQKEVLLQELQHRVANSLSIIASILTLKSRSVASDETRRHLEDARQRVLNVAAVQRHLEYTSAVEAVELSRYLTKLTESIAASMIAERQDIVVEVQADEVGVTSAIAVNVGLIVTELMINAIKYAFPDGRRGARILISYETVGDDWKLTVADNGVGNLNKTTGTGLGTAIVTALVSQLDAQLLTVSDANGMRVEVTHATFKSRR